MKSFSHRFISNPRLAWVIAIVISLCGALCLSRMPVSEYPNIIPVTITVKATYTGATAEVVNESVGMVLEDQINAVDDVWYFKSTSNAKGNYSRNAFVPMSVQVRLHRECRAVSDVSISELKGGNGSRKRREAKGVRLANMRPLVSHEPVLEACHSF